MMVILHITYISLYDIDSNKLLLITAIFLIQAKWNVFHSFALSGQIPLMDRLIEQGTDIDCLDKVRLPLF